MGEVVRAELMAVGPDGRVQVRFLKEVNGRTPVSWIAAKRLIDGVPSVGPS
jgi:hypothetical protein